MSPPLTSLIDQTTHIVPSFTLECGSELRNVPVAYKTWGKLNEAGTNVMVICHALTGSADVEDWWGPLMGPGKAFDPRIFFIVCCNVLGSPYGSASPIAIDPQIQEPYGPEFPPTTIRDDVRLHKVILDHLGVRSVYVAVGGSMGGMQVLEWPLCTAPGYIKHIIPLATSARHSAWGISWGEAQRKAVYSDPDYDDGWYFRTPGKGPAAGLAAARMSALLTYRSRDSFESRFGRKTQNKPSTSSDPSKDESGGNPAYAAHNEGHRSPRVTSPRPTSPRPSFQSQPQVFSAQSYLRYQGDKFTARFDANCYIHITRKMDTHDIARDREDEGDEDEDTSLARVLAQLPPALVISIASDGLFTPFEQKFIAKHILDSELVTIASEDGHDGFLLEFQAIGEAVKRWLRDRAKDSADVEWRDDVAEGEQDYSAKKTSVFGEAEVDVVNW
ncbi:Alpha/Beta hydrolase protein [Pterulicium gracile]|uniref:Alpha/Beta hydrolase protein n=1 Tax=Pterulicium gracile TaxID=1884261 RepID=A0A5C3QYC3_9AGAR|nr:Alpha/Beta hydrolase protein [Pterula gracilis]